jgi:ACR3 family arsenite efflux pump ArsB
MDKKLSLLVTLILAMGIFVGYVMGSIRAKAEHVKTEYYLELRPNSVVIESIDGYLIECPMDSIASVLERDNL